MSVIILDSCVVAKLLLVEADSHKAQELLLHASAGSHALKVLDLAFAEVGNAIWKRLRQRMITQQEAEALITSLRTLPVDVEPAAQYIEAAFDIARRYDRSVYDALFVALAHDRTAMGITSDEPLFRAVQNDYPEIQLLRNWNTPVQP